MRTLPSLLLFLALTTQAAVVARAENPIPARTVFDARIKQLQLELDELKQSRDQNMRQHFDESADVLSGNDVSILTNPERTLESDCEFCPPGFTLQQTEVFFNAPKYPTLNWSGFLQLDTGWVRQDKANEAAIGEVDASSGFRRVRLRVSGDVIENTSYVIDLDFAASGHPSFRDVAIQLHNVPEFQNVQFGRYKQPFGMDAMASGRELVLLERSLPFAFSPFRQTGLGASGIAANERMTWSVSGFRFPTDSFGVSIGNSGGYALAGRATFLPEDDYDDRLVHMGFGYSFGDPGNNVVRYRIEPSFFVTDPGDSGVGSQSVPTIVDTGNIPTSTFNLFNAELAARSGSFTLQTEARLAVVNQIGGPELFFPGAYVTASYLLTGESHPYDRKRGIFRR